MNKVFTNKILILLIILCVSALLVIPINAEEGVPTVGSPLDEVIYQYSKKDIYSIGIYPCSYDYNESGYVSTKTGIVNMYLPDVLYGGNIASDTFPTISNIFDNDGYITTGPQFVLYEDEAFDSVNETLRYLLYYPNSNYDYILYSLNGIFTSGFGVDFQYTLPEEWSYTVDGIWYTIYSTGSGDTYKTFADDYGVTASDLIIESQWNLLVDGEPPSYEGANVTYIDRIFVGNIVFARTDPGGLIDHTELPIFEANYKQDFYNLSLDDEDMVGSSTQPYIIQFMQQYANVSGDNTVSGILDITSNGVYSVADYAGVNVMVESDSSLMGFVDFFLGIAGAILEFEVAPGWNLGIIVSIVVVLALIIWCLKIFAGG